MLLLAVRCGRRRVGSSTNSLRTAIFALRISYRRCELDEHAELGRDVALSARVAELKTAVIPQLFTKPETIGEYGRSADTSEVMAELDKLMGRSPVTRLAEAIANIVAKLSDADPEKIAKAPTWLEKFTGKSLEVHVNYEVARLDLEALLAGAAQAAQDVHTLLGALDSLIESHAHDTAALRAAIQAGREFLAEHPEVGRPNPSAMTFDNPRERFERKLANLTTLLKSHELSWAQLAMTKAQAYSHLDRFEETSAVLVPIWRQHALSHTTSRDADPALVQKAVAAHRALLQSLTAGPAGATRHEAQNQDILQ